MFLEPSLIHLQLVEENTVACDGRQDSGPKDFNSPFQFYASIMLSGN